MLNALLLSLDENFHLDGMFKQEKWSFIIERRDEEVNKLIKSFRISETEFKSFIHSMLANLWLLI